MSGPTAGADERGKPPGQDRQDPWRAEARKRREVSLSAFLALLCACLSIGFIACARSIFLKFSNVRLGHGQAGPGDYQAAGLLTIGLYVCGALAGFSALLGLVFGAIPMVRIRQRGQTGGIVAAVALVVALCVLGFLVAVLLPGAFS